MCIFELIIGTLINRIYSLRDRENNTSSRHLFFIIFAHILLRFTSLSSPLLSWFAGGELQEAREALARADSSSSDSEDENNSKKKKDQDKPTEEVKKETSLTLYI